MAEDIVEIRLGKDTIQLKAPKSIALRMDIWAAWSDSTIRSFAAALAMCWASPGKPKTQLHQAKYNIPVFGGLVIEELAQRGYTAGQIQAGGLVAFMLCRRDLVSGGEVEEAENFSEEMEDRLPG